MTLEQTRPEKWYDEFALNCEGCGWLRQGEYLDGTPYLSCMNYGTIMEKQSNAICSAFRTPEYVKRKLAEMEQRKERRKKIQED